jgi:hypothetical protein
VRTLSPSRGLIAATLAVLVLAGACSHPDDETGPAVGSSLSSIATTERTAAPLPESAPGAGAIALGAIVFEFRVVRCEPEPAADAAAKARRLFSLEGEGKGREDVPFTITITRYESEAAEKTFSDNITYRDNARIFQAQRIEVGGVVNDPRDPDATTPLLSIDGTHVTGAGPFAAPGDPADVGVVPGRVDARCID